MKILCKQCKIKDNPNPNALDEKFAEQKESIRRLQFNGHVGLPADEWLNILL